MAKDVANDIIYFLFVELQYKSDVAGIRQWQNLKVAFDEKGIWVKDFTYAQIHSVEVKSIPYKTIFYAQNGKLFLLNSMLPHQNMPALLWTPIERALPIELPSFNHNYFGIAEKININLIESADEKEAVAMMVSLKNLQQYIISAASIRLNHLQWVILNNDKALIIGTPQLPIQGDAYWLSHQVLIPAGFSFDLYALLENICTKINPDNDALIIWNKDNTYFLVEKNTLQTLSLSSFKLSIPNLSVPQF